MATPMPTLSRNGAPGPSSFIRQLDDKNNINDQKKTGDKKITLFKLARYVILFRDPLPRSPSEGVLKKTWKSLEPGFESHDFRYLGGRDIDFGYSIQFIWAV